jgi:hypothetical protein
MQRLLPYWRQCNTSSLWKHRLLSDLEWLVCRPRLLSCRIIWQVNVTDIVANYAPFITIPFGPRPVSRTSPQIDGNILFFGTLTHALVVAVNRLTGELLSTIQINSHPMAVVTMSPTFFDGKLFIGASSVEENLTLQPTYPCCSFIGNMVALAFDGKNFRVLWNVSMIPEAQAALGWSGAALGQPTSHRQQASSGIRCNRELLLPSRSDHPMSTRHPKYHCSCPGPRP